MHSLFVSANSLLHLVMHTAIAVADCTIGILCSATAIVMSIILVCLLHHSNFGSFVTNTPCSIGVFAVGSYHTTVSVLSCHSIIIAVVAEPERKDYSWVVCQFIMWAEPSRAVGKSQH